MILSAEAFLGNNTLMVLNRGNFEIVSISGTHPRPTELGFLVWGPGIYALLSYPVLMSSQG